MNNRGTSRPAALLWSADAVAEASRHALVTKGHRGAERTAMMAELPADQADTKLAA